MITFKNIFLFIFISIAPFVFISCTDDGPLQPKETENQLELDSELIGTWKQISRMKEKLVIKKKSSTEGIGFSITQDKNDWCENELLFFERRDFRWTQTKKESDGWSAIYYDEFLNQECDGAERNSPLSFERYYKIEGDTLYLGTEDYSTYVRVE